MVNPIMSIAKKEFMDRFRNNWIISFSVLFAILVIIVSYFGTATGEGLESLESTIAGLKSITMILIPIIALILSFATIVGEIEKGLMNSLLSLPLKKYEIILGKFLGLGSIICLTIFIGFVIAGIFIALHVSNSDYGLYITFIGASILLGLAFLSVGMLLSSFFKTHFTAVSGAIFIWIFFSVLWQLITYTIMSTSIQRNSIGESSGTPNWFYQMQLFNPITAYSAIGNSNTLSVYWVVLSLIIWIVFPLLTAFWIFEKRDI